MNARKVVIEANGGPERLSVQDMDLPVPGPGEVRIRVERAGVAFADVMLRKGNYPVQPPFPFTPGWDVVGFVDAIGDGVSSVELEQRVLALTKINGNSSYVCVPAWRAVPVSEGLDATALTALGLNYLTAYQMLKRVGDVKPGHKVLVHSAAGGVGTAVLQLGKVLGLEMYGTASAAKHDSLASYGATLIDYRSEDFAAIIKERVPEGLDLSLDPIGFDSWQKTRDLLKPEGTLAAFGFMGQLDDSDSIFGLVQKAAEEYAVAGRKFAFFSMNDRDDQEEYREDLTEIIRLFERGDLQPVIAAEFPLAEVARAHELLESGKASGKIILNCE